MNFKKIITLLLAFTLTLSLAACGELTARLEHVRRMELPTVENVM